MKKIGSLSVVFLFLMMAQPVWAEIKVMSTVDRNQVGLGDYFKLQITVSSDNTVRVEEPSLPVIQGVQLVDKNVGSETHSSVQNTPHGLEFKTIVKKVYTYQFTTTQKGKVDIGAIRVQAGGKTHATKPITISVTERSNVAGGGGRPGQVRPKPRSNDPISRMEEQFNQLLRRSRSRFGLGPGPSAPKGQGGPGGFMTEPKTNEAFFILAEVDKKEAFKGEQIVASWYLYTRGTVAAIDTLKYPTLKGFWKEDIQLTTHLNYEQDVINGIPYKRALLASYALFPIEKGKALIDSYKAKATIVGFGGFGFGRRHAYTKASEEIKIDVKPLPTEGMPTDFTGAVGNFQMSSEIKDKSVVSGQPFALKVRFDGKGNAKLIELPSLNLPNSIEIYDVKNESKYFKNGTSYKEFEVLLIPRDAGDIEIPTLKSSYFDPKKQEYVLLETTPIPIKVLPGSKQLSMGNERLKSEGGEEEVKALPLIAATWDPQYKPPFNRMIFWGFAFLVGFFVLIARLVYELGLFVRNPDIRDVMKQRFAHVYGHLGKNQYRQVGIEVTNTVYQVLGEVSGEGGANVELNKLLSKTAPSVRREIETPLRKLMDYFGVLGFGPNKVIEQIKNPKEVKEKVKTIEDLMFKAIKLSRGSEKEND